MKDKDGKELKEGSICFYTERPYSNYADSIVEVYSHEGVLKVGYILVNGLSCTEYQIHGRDEENDLKLENYTWDIFNKPTGIAENLQLIDGITASDVTLDFANERYPLGL